MIGISLITSAVGSAIQRQKQIEAIRKINPDYKPLTIENPPPPVAKEESFSLLTVIGAFLFGSLF